MPRFTGWKPVPRNCVAVLLAAALWIVIPSVLRADEPAAKAGTSEKSTPAEKKAKPDPFAWKSLFDGRSLKGWKVPNYGGVGEVGVKDGEIVIEAGFPMNGITWAGGDLPKTNYELEFDAKRTLGNDFFATTTFPVGDESASFVTGGWGGTLVGISCIDGYDAADNDTTDFFAFKENQWYRIRVRVTDAKIECWIDKKQLVDVERAGRKFSVRIEVDLSVPLGVTTYETEGHVRNVRIRRLKSEEIAAPKEGEANEAPGGQPDNGAAGEQLFDGKTLGKWKVVDAFDFRKHGKVEVADGAIVMHRGSPATGVKWTGPLPKTDYELSFEAKRIEGDDFFGSVTFPVGQKALTLVLGGWNGQVVGLSSVDGDPAVDNETCSYTEFEQNRWYRVRLKVAPARIEAWIDDEKVVDLDCEYHEFAIYWEMEPLLPLGIATWHTTGAVRKIRLTRVES